MNTHSQVALPLELELRKLYGDKERMPDSIINADNIDNNVYETIIYIMGLKKVTASKILKFINLFKNKNLNKDIIEMYNFYKNEN